ncbi:MAG: crossover junction endodeoxyribonuclease RuvC [Eubacterium sp.]|jgi:crossover junction endodeoxyribonuclease RuvC|nr:crossover junction endodeoxyribonuclease RuvC [Eubacterium sp.]
MRVIGVDPGFATVGFGIIDNEKSRFNVIEYGVISTSAKKSFDLRLLEIYNDLLYLLDIHKPDCAAIEQLYFTTNQKTVIEVAEARGVILLAARQRGIRIFEYTPLQVKSAVTGYGKAVKKQVQELTKRILCLSEIPKPDDAADALAIAICHSHSFRSKLISK